ncbi:hypothetical protein AB1Y20_001716 [Prymnesium parvum]|uniref:Imidazoleglycerol-phosphate dehydratase n=1 Tax=Prymnesium parvum TaxID=97485 RepID=A0AB34K902_PRYPA
MPLRHATSGLATAEAEVVDLGARGTISTGICFLDHMVDQLTAHAQLGVTLRLSLAEDAPQDEASPPCKRRRELLPSQDYAAGSPARLHDRDIVAASGAALGAALADVIAAASCGHASPAVFCCPLDEAFSEATLELRPPAERAGRCAVSLEPYGTFASSAAGRRWVGRFRTDLTPVFWQSLAVAMGVDLTLRRVRGANAHHVLEATFKAFARALRAALDAAAAPCERMPCAPPPAVEQSGAARRAQRQRTTKETRIEVWVNLDSPWCESDPLTTGVALLDRILLELVRATNVKVGVRCEGDTHIDDHHTAEDVAITLGQCLHEALGDKTGLVRMGCAVGAHDAASCRAVLDLSNRPHFESNLLLDEEYVGGGVGDDAVCGHELSCEMLHHVFDSLTLEMRATVHLEVLADDGKPGHTLAIAIAAARAYGTSLSDAASVDPRRRGVVASSKGTLSK